MSDTPTAKACAGTACLVRKDLAGYVRPEAQLLDASDRLRSATFVVNTRASDRDGDVVEPSGCVPDNWYRNGATWFLNHDTDKFPVGSSVHAGAFHLRIEPGRVIATEFFDDGDVGRELYRFVSKGWFPGTSIGFRPLELDRIKGKAEGTDQAAGYHVKRWELLEVSNVGVGANQEALLIELGKSAAGMVLKSLGAWSWGVTLKAASGLSTAVAADGGALVPSEMDKASALDVQRVCLPKDRFPAQDDAVKWLEAHGFAADVTEDGDLWAADQFPAAELREGTGRVEELTDGVTARCGLRVHEPQAEGVTVKSAEHVCTCGKAATVTTKEAPMAEPLDNESANPDAGNDTATKRMKAGHAFIKAMKSVLDEHGEVQDHPEMEKMHKALCKTLYKHATKAYPDEDFDLEKPEEEEGPGGEEEGAKAEEGSAEEPAAMAENEPDEDDLDEREKALLARFEKVSGQRV